MKKNSHLSTRQLLFVLASLLAFLGLAAFLFTYQQDDKRFTSLTARLFEEDMKANTLSLHYTLANPADFGITDYKAVLPCYTAQGALGSQAELENTLASLRRLNPAKLSSACGGC